jgi:hypothetical protein
VTDLADTWSADDTLTDNLSNAPDWRDDELLAEGFAANPKTLRALQRACRFSHDQAASACRVSLRTYRRWLASGNPDPTALRLLAILAGYVPWSGWDGWEVHNGYLFPPGYRRGGIPPGEFFALVFYRQQVTAYQQEHLKLQARLAELEAGDPAELLGRLATQERELQGYRRVLALVAEQVAQFAPAGVVACG